MTVQVIVATMHQKDHSLLERMNIQSDAIICNQCDKDEVENFEYRCHKIKWMSFAERGVSLNRNNGLMRATEDIILFADEEVVYFDNYVDIITNYYKNNPKAEVVLFNLSEKSEKESEFFDTVTRNGKVTMRSATKYGAPCISVRRECIEFQNIVFHRNFGGGSKYSCGEDTLFLQDCIKHKMKVFSTTDKIGTLVNGESTWYKGITDKYFFDKGIVYYLINSFLAKPYSFYHCLKHRTLYANYGWFRGFKKMCEGVNKAKRL